MPFPNAKTNLYDAGARLPLIVRAPGTSASAVSSTTRLVSWTDITPTILDWTGAKAPEYALQGQSLMPILEQENPAGSGSCFLIAHVSRSNHVLSDSRDEERALQVLAQFISRN